MLKFKYFLHLIGLTLPFFCVIAWGATPISSSTKDILKQLDKTLAEETLYTQEKEKEIDQLKARLPQATEAERYSIFNGLFDAYKKYQTDSALHYVDLKEELLLLHPALAPIEEVQMNRVEELSLMGMYKEALDILAEYATEHPDSIKLCLELAAIFRKLERAGDHISNLAEETVFYIDAEVLKHTKSLGE